MLSLVIPVYKNEANLPRLFSELEALAARVPDPMEVVFVVDGSPDASLQILRDRLPSWPVRSQLIELSRNFGSFPAIAAGMRYGTGEHFAALAADLQEPPELVLEFHRLLKGGGADVVFGYRASRADAWSSQTASEWFWRLYRRFVVKDMVGAIIHRIGSWFWGFRSDGRCTCCGRSRLLPAELDSRCVRLPT